MNYQKLILIGNATKDAEAKLSQDENFRYTSFRLAVSDGKKETVFFPITVFGKQGEVVARYVTKGREVLVEGRVEVGRTGQMSVVADRVVFGTGGRQGSVGSGLSGKAMDPIDTFLEE